MSHANDYRKMFADILRETRIMEGDSKKNKAAYYNRLNGYIRDNMPQSLFRYRTLETHNIEALRRNLISVTKPSEMGDVFDSHITVDVNRVISAINEMEGCADSVSSHLYEGKPIPPLALHSVSRPIRRAFTKNKYFLKNNLSLKSVMRYASAFACNDLRKRAQEEFGKAKDVLRKTGYIACFCEDRSNLKMWSDYADKHRGYALEYSFETLNAKFPTVITTGKSLQPDHVVLPVIYGDKYDSTEIIIHSLANELLREKGGKDVFIKHPDELWSIKGYLYKSKDYESECEWRLITPLKGVSHDSQSYSNVYAKPKAIYYGTKMNDVAFHKLDTIAQENGLERYRMEASQSDARVEAIPLN
jgi:hypothetical protein